MDREKVIKGFTICSEHGLLNGEDCHGHYEYTDNLADIIKANDYSKQCPYNGCETGCVKTLAKDTLAMLKEQQEQIDRLLEENASNAEMAEGLNELLKEQEEEISNYKETIENLLQQLQDIGKYMTPFGMVSDVRAYIEGREQPEIIRCYACKHGEKANDVYLCGKSRGFGIAHNPSWFCADGERR